MHNDILFSEFIVSFRGYYTITARRRFISAALQDSSVTSWKVLPRNNLAYDYPSDFEVVKVYLNLWRLIHNILQNTYPCYLHNEVEQSNLMDVTMENIII